MIVGKSLVDIAGKSLGIISPEKLSKPKSGSLTKESKKCTTVKKLNSSEVKKVKSLDTVKLTNSNTEKVKKKSRASPTPCPYCDSILSRTDNLKPHIIAKHPGQKLPVKIVSTNLSPKKTDTESKVIVLGKASSSSKTKPDGSTQDTKKKEGSLKKKVECDINSEPLKLDPKGPGKKKKRSNPTPCPYCDLILSRSDAVRGHVISKHPKVKVPEKGLPFPKKSIKKGKTNSQAKTSTSSTKKDNADKKSSANEKSKIKPKSAKTIEKSRKQPGSEAQFESPSSRDWKNLWQAGSPVYVKFNFSKQQRKRKRTRTESCNSVDLETLLSDDYCPSKSICEATEDSYVPGNQETPTINRNGFSKMFNSQVSMKKLYLTDIPKNTRPR